MAINPKELLLKLLKSDTENEIVNILNKYELNQNKSAWRDFGDKENNYSVAGNQQTLPETAFVEKIVNSVDSMLTLKCIEKGYNPESNQKPTPQSVNEAVEDFFGIKNGKLTELTAGERTKLAENSIGIVATGNSPKNGFASYSIFDFGEGQAPKDIPNTFMSIGANNKIKIPFVQGKFNQGGTGVFRFCADDACQLLLTKRNPSMLSDSNMKNEWGFSIVKRIQVEGYKSSKYVYLVNPIDDDPQNNDVFSFDEKELNILPGVFPDAYSKPMSHGTYIKLFEYKLQGLKTNLTLDPYNRLSLLLTNLPIPIRLYERREGFKKANTKETTLNGLSIRLEEDRSGNLESKDWPVSTMLHVDGTPIPVKIYAFKETESGKRPTANYTKNEGVIFTINGQTHGSFDRRFFSRKTVQLTNIADSLVVIVDCTSMSTYQRESLFMTSRDRLAESGPLRSKIEKALELLLKDHEGLKRLKTERHQKNIQDRVGDSKPLVDVINQIMKSSPSLSKIFLKGQRLSNPFNLDHSGKEEEDYEGSEFPSYFKLIHEFDEESPKKFDNSNDKMRIQFKTDVVNDYFEREKDPGKAILLVQSFDSKACMWSPEKEFDDISVINLFNGTATLNIEINQKYNLKDRLKLKLIVSDVSNQLEPFENEFYLEIIEPKKKSKPKNEGRRKPPVNEGDGEEPDNSKLGLPEIIEVRKNDNNWNRLSFDDYSALAFEDLGEEIGKTFYLNMDNRYYLTERKSNRKVNQEIIESQYKTANSLIALSIIKAESDKQLNLPDDYSSENLVLEATKSISMILIPMILELGALSSEEN